MDYTPLDGPESIPTVFTEAWNNRDPDKLASIFDEDAEFVNVTPRKRRPRLSPPTRHP
jgi:hypothetical protein